MVLLLGSRGRSRSRGKSFFASLSRVVHTLLGRSSNGNSALLRRDARRPDVPWLALGIALLCFAGGYLTGSHFGGGPAKEGEAGLKTAPRQAGLIEFDARALKTWAFIVSVYQGMPAAEARDKAKDLSDYLRGKGLETARPYEYPTEANGKLWVVAVYFDGPKEEKEVRERLQALEPDVPDVVFVSLRNNSGQDWPLARPIQ